MPEDIVYNDFAYGDLSWLGAVKRLVVLGHDRDDAERVVDEWADALSVPE